MALRKRDRFIYGVLIPVAALFLWMIIRMNIDNRGGAAEFAALAVPFMLIMSVPATIVINLSVMLTGVAHGGVRRVPAPTWGDI